MKNIEFIQKDVQNLKIQESIPGMVKSSFTANAGKHLKNFIYITGLAGIGLFANSCSLGYVATEPVYTEYARPARPSNLHVWIDGDWIYNRQTHAYARNTGYWESPRQNSTYVSGSWQKDSRGQYWKKGKWQSNDSKSKRNNR